MEKGCGRVVVAREIMKAIKIEASVGKAAVVSTYRLRMEMAMPTNPEA